MNNKRVAIIDDDPEFVNSLALFFEKHNFMADRVTDSLKSMDVIKKNRADLVLLDVQMPQLSGMDVLKMIKKYDPSIPVVVLSAYKVPAEAFKLGAELCLNKPLPPDEIMRSVIDILEKKTKFPNCNGCENVIQKNEGRYLMPEGIFCEACRDNLPD